MQGNTRAVFKFSSLVRLGLCLAGTALLASCSAPALRNQFRNYNEAYAEALNQQMLLNLARLENGHPAYYLAIGLIDNKYTFSSQTAAGSSGTFQDTRSAGIAATLLRVLGFNANQTVTAISNPEFQFIPINNETAARQVLEPISTDVFLTLYQQGYPIDQLLRVLIERIETPTLPDGTRLVLVNSPTHGTPEGYARFLRACGILRELQKHGFLALEASSEKDLLGPVSFGASGPQAKDFTDAEDKGCLLGTNGNGAWQIYRKRATPRFVLRSEVPLAVPGVEKSPESSARSISPLVNAAIEFLKTNHVSEGITEYRAGDYDAITNAVIALSAGITVQTGLSTGHESGPRLVLRSFNRAMEAVAAEQAGFDALLKNNPVFQSRVPLTERQPILKMQWPETRAADLAPPLEKIRYAGKDYLITDAKTDPLDPRERWNRDVFRLMVALGSQVTVDISKFQRQVFQLSQ